MNWTLSHRAHGPAVALADRHYSRQKPGTPQFVPPGSCFVLLTPDADAVWVTARPKAEYVKHAWAGAWTNPMFRNESPLLSSQLIREACACSRWHYGEPPPLGLVTFVRVDAVRSSNPGCCYKKAGFKSAGKTKGGLIALRLAPEDFPEAAAPEGVQLALAA